MSALLKPRPVSSKRFTYDKADRTFTAEASDLGGDLGQVYPDACDVGLTLISEKTGREVVCRVAHEERNAEGELLWTILEPALPQERGLFRVRLFND